MNSRFRKLAVESLEGRSVLSTMVEADFNNDSYPDRAEITDPNTITVSLFDSADGSYHVSGILSVPKSQPVQDLGVWDYDADGDMDIYAVGSKHAGTFYSVNWLNSGEGTFTYVEPFRWKHSKWWV